MILESQRVRVPRRTTLLATICACGATLAQEPPRLTECIAALADPGRVVRAQVELRAFGAAAAVPLAEAIGAPDLDEVARGAATRVLMDLGPHGVPAFELLAGYLREPYLPASVVENAVYALLRIGPFAGERAQRLGDALAAANQASGWRREAMAWRGPLVPALRFRGDQATLVELLGELQRDDPIVRAIACRVLAARRDEFAHEAPAVVASLGALIGEEVSAEQGRWRYFAGAAQLEVPTRESVRALRTEASLALLEFAPDDPRTLLGHCQRLFDLDPERGILSAKALGRLRHADATRWLVDCASSTVHPGLALEALDAVRRIGPPAASEAHRLEELAQAPDARVAKTARLVLRVVAPDREDRAQRTGRLEVFELGLPPGSPIELRRERARLIAWLDADAGAQRLALQDDERAIDAYHGLSAEDGGPLHPNARWLPIRVFPDELRPGFWRASGSHEPEDVVDAAPVGALGPERTRLVPLPWILELVLVDAGRERVRAGDVLGFGTVSVYGQTRPTWVMHLDDARLASIAEWLVEIAGRSGTVGYVLDGLLVSRRSLDLPVELRHLLWFGVRDGHDDRIAVLRRR